MFINKLWMLWHFVKYDTWRESTILHYYYWMYQIKCLVVTFHWFVWQWRWIGNSLQSSRECPRMDWLVCSCRASILLSGSVLAQSQPWRLATSILDSHNRFFLRCGGFYSHRIAKQPQLAAMRSGLLGELPACHLSFRQLEIAAACHRILPWSNGIMDSFQAI